MMMISRNDGHAGGPAVVLERSTVPGGAATGDRDGAGDGPVVTTLR